VGLHFHHGVTDLNAGTAISGAYLAISNLILENYAQVNNLLESISTGTTRFAGCNPVAVISNDLAFGGTFTQDIPLDLTSKLAVQLAVDALLPLAGDSFGLLSFYLGFDESVPEPSTFAPVAAVALFRRISH
jgi:hypothetical protein